MSLVTVTRSYTRPTTTTSWYVPSPEFVEFWNNTYVKTGLIVSRTESLSTDGLTLTIVNVWKDLSSRESRMNNTTAQGFFAIRSAYNAAQGIIETTPVVTAMVQI